MPPRGKTKQPDLSHIAKDLRSLAVPIETLNQDPDNARVHSARNVQAIRNSLERFGQRQPLIVQKQGMIVRAGNARLQAALELKWTHVAVIVLDENEAEALAYAIADNRTAELADWDYPNLAKALKMFDDTDIDMSLLGWEGDEIDWLQNVASTVGDGGVVSEVEPWHAPEAQEPTNESQGAGDDTETETGNTCPKCGYTY